MEIDMLREFITFSRHMNVTKAADELHLAPSSLSRHISIMERELGIPLVAHKGARLFLTTAGSQLLDEASAITARYDALLERISGLKHSCFEDVRIAYALDDRSVIDTVSLAYISLKDALNGMSVRSENIRVKGIFDALKNNEIDIAIMYDLADVDLTIYCAVPLMDDSILVALPKSAATASLREVTPSDVMNRIVPWPSASRDNYLQRALRLFDACEKKPAIHWVDADNMDTFFMHILDEQEMWFFSKRQYESYANCVPTCFMSSIVVCEVKDADAAFKRYAVYRRDTRNEAVPLFAQALADVLEDET